MPLMGRVADGAHIIFRHNPREAYGALLTVPHPVCRPILCAFDSFVWQGWHKFVSALPTTDHQEELQELAA